MMQQDLSSSFASAVSSERWGNETVPKPNGKLLLLQYEPALCEQSVLRLFKIPHEIHNTKYKMVQGKVTPILIDGNFVFSGEEIMEHLFCQYILKGAGSSKEGERGGREDYLTYIANIEDIQIEAIGVYNLLRSKLTILLKEFFAHPFASLTQAQLVEKMLASSSANSSTGLVTHQDAKLTQFTHLLASFRALHHQLAHVLTSSDLQWAIANPKAALYVGLLMLYIPQALTNVHLYALLLSSDGEHEEGATSGEVGKHLVGIFCRTWSLLFVEPWELWRTYKTKSRSTISSEENTHEREGNNHHHASENTSTTESNESISTFSNVIVNSVEHQQDVLNSFTNNKNTHLKKQQFTHPLSFSFHKDHQIKIGVSSVSSVSSSSQEEEEEDSLTRFVLSLSLSLSLFLF